MARAKSEEKRNALLTAATQVFARNGLSASTASITQEAGLAEGTLFVYFKGKDELINTLYEEIKQDFAQAMLSDYPRKASLRVRTQHIWDKYVGWGLENPDSMAVMHRIKVWEGLQPEVREATAARFAELHLLTESAISQGVFQDVPQDFVIAMLSTQAEMTMQFIRLHPKEADLYKDKGFEIFWNGICRKESKKK